MEALKENPDLLNSFAFFSDLHEHFKNKTTNTLAIGKNLNVEFILIKAVKGFKQIREKVEQVLQVLDPNYRPFRQERDSERLRTIKTLRVHGGVRREETKQSHSTVFLDDNHLTPNDKLRSPDVRVHEAESAVMESRRLIRQRSLSAPKPDRISEDSEDSKEEVKEDEVKIRIEEIPIRLSQVSDIDEKVDSKKLYQNLKIEEDQPEEETKNPPVGAASYLLRHNPLARAMMTVSKMPGWRLKGMPTQQPLPIKEIPDEDVSADFDNDVLLESRRTAERLNKLHTDKGQGIPREGLRDVIELLYEILNVAREQSESISEAINDAEVK